jgi:hypothetical protein
MVVVFVVLVLVIVVFTIEKVTSSIKLRSLYWFVVVLAPFHRAIVLLLNRTLAIYDTSAPIWRLEAELLGLNASAMCGDFSMVLNLK